MITYPLISFQTNVDDKPVRVNVLTQVLDRGQFRFYVKCSNEHEDIYVHDAIQNTWFSENSNDCKQQACFKAIEDDLVTLEFYPAFKHYMVHRQNIDGIMGNIKTEEPQTRNHQFVFN